MPSVTARVRALRTFAAVIAGVFAREPAALGQWKPVPGHIMTQWAKDVSPDAPWPEYPRPTMVREKWQNLNGLWDYSITGLDAQTKDTWEGKILVPFPIESALSGVGKPLKPDQLLHYRRALNIPVDWKGQRVLLHFGAVDWKCKVLVNGKLVGEHVGGYDPFTCEITGAIKDGTNELTVIAQDPTDTGGQPRGKQWLTPRGIWYTPTSGIWQTVWMEPVPAASISRLNIKADAAMRQVRVNADFQGEGVFELEAKVEGTTISVMHATDGVTIGVVTPKLWSPDDPHLYTMEVRLKQDGKVIDSVTSYFAFRDVKVGKDEKGINRLMLNGTALFQYGPLDQGFWPDGLYTPPTDEAMKFDIQAVKKMGGNMLRKHVKVESERFYYWCDTMGMLVWQDMPSPFFAHKDWKEKLPELTTEWKQNFEMELHHMVDARRAHPSIVMWVPFNEGWGQNDFDWCKAIVAKIKEWDPTRLVNNASGWTDLKVGDVSDVHVYPGPGLAPVEASRASVLGEFGGLGLPLEGHTWVAKDNWGYVSYKSKAELTDAYVELIKQMPLLIGQGLTAAVYTQTTDVEIECNGWLTYDRAEWKIDPVRAFEATKALYQPPPTMKVIVGHAGNGEAAEWRVTTDKPGDDWIKPGFDDSSWKRAKAGFGSKGTPGAVIGTEWTGTDIWIRRTVDLGKDPLEHPNLSIHHDENAEVYINGELVATLKGYTSGYQAVPLSAAAAKLLKAGANSLAIHCHQTTGGQYIDCGVVDIKAAAK